MLRIECLIRVEKKWIVNRGENSIWQLLLGENDSLHCPLILVAKVSSPKHEMFLSVPGMKRQPSLPCSSLQHTSYMLQARTIWPGDSLALLLNALCLRHKTGSFQSVVTLWGTFTHFPPGKAKTYFSIVSQKCLWVSEAWQAASEAGLPCSIFRLCLIWSGCSGEERREEGAQVSLTSNPASVCQRLEKRVVKILLAMQ